MSAGRDYPSALMWDASRQRQKPRRSTALAPVERPLRRFWPVAGALLTVDEIKGQWRPSGTAAGTSTWSVIWQTRDCTLWAPLSDFSASAQLELIESCRRLDAEQNGGWR